MASYGHALKRTSLTLVGLLAAAQVVSATLFSVSFDTSPLIGDLNGPFAIEYLLTDGNGTGNANNSVNIYGFGFGIGGAPSNSLFVSGGAAGSLAGVISLTDTLAYSNLFWQTFTPGSNLTFFVDASETPDTPFADDLSFYILDKNTNAVPTIDFLSSFFYFDLGTGTPEFGVSYGTFPSDSLAEPFITLNAPIITFIPEPSTVLLLGAGVGVIGWSRRRRA